MEKVAKSKPFDVAIETFLTQIESLWTTLPLIQKTLNRSKADSTKIYDEFLRTKCEFITSENHYLISPDNFRKYRILKKDMENNHAAYTIIKRNFLVSLVSQYDTYIGALIRCIFEIRPELINASEKQLTFAQLTTFSSIEAAREYIIEKEIETVLRENHTDQFKWFERKLSINLLKDLPIWSTFIELTQRRNLFVHTDGRVSSQYLSVCKENNVRLPASLKVGDLLDADKKYYDQAFVCLFEIGLKLNQVLRRILVPTEIEEADASFLNISFELIQNGQYDLAREVYDFADKYIKKFSSNDISLRITLNRAQTYKWLGNNEKCVQIINGVDWSATGDLFKLGSSILLDDFGKAAALMEDIGDNPKVLDKSAYKDWPIFKEFVKSQIFRDAFKKIYKTEFEITEEKTVN